MSIIDDAVDDAIVGAQILVGIRFKPEGQKIAILFNGIQGSGKSTLARALTEYFNAFGDETAKWYNQDEYSGSRQAFLFALSGATENVIIIDKCHQDEKTRSDTLSVITKRRIIWVSLSHPDDRVTTFDNAKKVCIMRIKQRKGHRSLKAENAERAVNTLKWSPITPTEFSPKVLVIKLYLTKPLETNLTSILNKIGIDKMGLEAQVNSELVVKCIKDSKDYELTL